MKTAIRYGQALRMTPNGWEELTPAPALPVGTQIIAYGYAMAVQYFAIYDNDRHAVEIATDDYLDAYFAPLHQVEECVLPIEKKYGIGFYYDLSAPKYTAEQIAEGLERAERIERAKKERAEAQAKAEAEAIANARAKYPYMKENARGAEVAANMRAELRKLWGGVKFSVRYKSFSGGDEIAVKYEDGPREKDVKAVINKYQDHDADFTGDYWDYMPNAFNKVFGGVSFVMLDRTYSAETLAKASEFVARVCPELTAEIHRDKFFEAWRGVGEDAQTIIKAIGSAAWISPQSLARWVAALEDYSPTVEETKPQAPKPQGARAEGLQVVEYSEKSFAIIGQTKEIKDLLKSLGGKFNARLTCGAGWVFQSSKRAEVLNALNL